jgi:hypothetical protein
MYPCGGSLGKPTYTVEYKQLVEGSALVILSSVLWKYHVWGRLFNEKARLVLYRYI